MRYYDSICEVRKIVIKNIYIFKSIETSCTIEVSYELFFFGLIADYCEKGALCDL